jgi:hypothetical protein
MFDRKLLDKLSVLGQALKDFDDEVIKELIIVITMAGIEDSTDNAMSLANLDQALILYKMSANSAIVHFSYLRGSQTFNVKIFREVISLSVDDIKLLAAMPFA